MKPRNVCVDVRCPAASVRSASGGSRACDASIGSDQSDGEGALKRTDELGRLVEASEDVMVFELDAVRVDVKLGREHSGVTSRS